MQETELMQCDQKPKTKKEKEGKIFMPNVQNEIPRKRGKKYLMWFLSDINCRKYRLEYFDHPNTALLNDFQIFSQPQ